MPYREDGPTSGPVIVNTIVNSATGCAGCGNGCTMLVLVFVLLAAAEWVWHHPPVLALLVVGVGWLAWSRYAAKAERGRHVSVT